MALNREVFGLSDRRQLTISVFANGLKGVILTASRLKAAPNPHDLSDLVAWIGIEGNDDGENLAREVNAGRCPPSVLAGWIEDHLDYVRVAAHSSLNREEFISTILAWLCESPVSLTR